jgi:hypothetical protein
MFFHFLNAFCKYGIVLWMPCGVFHVSWMVPHIYLFSMQRVLQVGIEDQAKAFWTRIHGCQRKVRLIERIVYHFFMTQLLYETT